MKLLLDRVLDEDGCRGDANGPFDEQTVEERREELKRDKVGGKSVLLLLLLVLLCCRLLSRQRVLSHMPPRLCFASQAAGSLAPPCPTLAPSLTLAHLCCCPSLPACLPAGGAAPQG
jgi:hypothetical protein